MPQIPPTPHPIFTLLQIFAFLESPDDPAQRDAFLTRFANLTLAQAFAREVIDPATLNRNQKKMIADAPSPAAFYAAIDDGKESYGRDVGEIFLTVLALADQAPVIASVNSAVALQIRRRVNRGKPEVTRDHLMRKWSEKKSVSHFYAAIWSGCRNELGPLYGLRDFWRDAVPDETAKLISRFEEIDIQNEAIALRLINWLVDFASIAEKLRRQASRVFAHGQKVLKRPLLSEEEAWHFGPEIQLPVPEFCVARLHHDELNFLLR